MRWLLLAFVAASSHAATITFTGSASAFASGQGMTDTINNIQDFFFEIVGPPGTVEASIAAGNVRRRRGSRGGRLPHHRGDFKYRDTG